MKDSIKLEKIFSWASISSFFGLLLVSLIVGFRWYHSEKLRLIANKDYFENASSEEILLYINDSKIEKTAEELNILALELLEKGQIEEAIHAFRLLISEDSNNLLLRYHFAVDLFNFGVSSPEAYNESLLLFTGILNSLEEEKNTTGTSSEKQPSKYEIYHFLGWIAHSQERYQESATYFQLIYDDGNATNDDILLLSWCYAYLKDWKKAVYTLKSSKDPDSIDTVTTLVYFLCLNNNLKEALLLYEDRCSKEPNEHVLLEKITGMLASEQEYNKAIEFITLSLQNHPNNLHALHQKARLHHWAGQHRKSAEVYRQLLKETASK